ncbi:MICOS complex subunit Mic10 - like 1 [Theobroma cacao]|nr:MICOS complex subunit Mic10 - like 1 [Theobroma cacao]
MAEDKDLMPAKYDVNAKWDACLDLTVRRFVYSSLAGAFGGLLFFRSPVTRWASVAFGAGIGIGSAYTDCSRIFDGSSATLAPPKLADAPAPQVGLMFYSTKSLIFWTASFSRSYFHVLVVCSGYPLSIQKLKFS